MPRLEWDAQTEREITIGVDRGVVYPMKYSALPWNGLVSVKEAPQTTDLTESYFDGEVYNTSFSRTGVGVTVEAFTYPQEFDEEDVVNLRGMSWRNQTAKSYEIHILYNVKLIQEDVSRTTLSDSVDLTLFSWEGITKPAFAKNMLATSHVVIVVDKTTPDVVELLENLLYGSIVSPPILPTLDEIVSIFEQQLVFIIIDHGDGTWTALGPDDWIQMVDATEFLIKTPSAYYITEKAYNVRSW
jgi:hypothetical protein